MSGPVLTLAALATLVVDPACGGVRADTPAGEAVVRHVVATIRQESGGRPLAIRDEATGESLFPATLADAVRLATERAARGHLLGLGLGQITGSRNLARHGLTIETAFEPCRAVAATVRHLAGDVRHVLALSSRRYNTGSIERGDAYARSVAALAAALPPDLVASAARPAADAPPLLLVPEPPAPPPCAPSWDGWALAECTAREVAPRVQPTAAPSGVVSATVTGDTDAADPR